MYICEVKQVCLCLFHVFQVRERLRVALERCSALEEQLTISHKEVRKRDLKIELRENHWLTFNSITLYL